MKKVNRLIWKKFMEGLARKTVGPFRQLNSFKDRCSYRDYYDGDSIVARMSTHDDGYKCLHDCNQYFEIEKDIVELVYPHYIPTDEEYDEWDHEELTTNRPIASEKIKEIEERHKKFGRWK